MKTVSTILAGLALALFCSAALGATYYVATTGSDSNPGSSSLPWLTLQHAVDTIASGDNYYLKAGSPAIDAGTTISSVTDDLDGVSRPQGNAYDAGCYEY